MIKNKLKTFLYINKKKRNILEFEFEN